MRYTTIIFEVKKELGLSLREYLLLDTVYHLKTQTGWCYAKNEYFGELLEISIREVQKIKSKLSSDGFLLSQGAGSKMEIKTTDKWNAIYLNPTMNKTPPLPRTKVHGNHEQKFTHTIYKESNNKIDIPEVSETPQPEQPKFTVLGADIVKAMESIDVRNKLFYGNPVQRKACDFLIENYGFEIVKEMIFVISQNMQKIFNPPTTPVQLRDNWVRVLSEQAYKSYSKQIKKPEVVHA